MLGRVTTLEAGAGVWPRPARNGAGAMFDVTRDSLEAVKCVSEYGCDDECRTLCWLLS